LVDATTKVLPLAGLFDGNRPCSPECDNQILAGLILGSYREQLFPRGA
jgi:hypothetical protein